MRTYLLGLWLLLGLLSVSVERAKAWGLCDLFPPVQIDAGINAYFNVHILDWSHCGQVGPWYLYFPYEAYFQTPAPVGGYWPAWNPLPPSAPVSVPAVTTPPASNGKGS